MQDDPVAGSVPDDAPVSRRRLLIGGSAALAAALVRTTHAASRLTGRPTVVTTTSGRLRGQSLPSGVIRFRGIPYGASVAGKNRFRPSTAAPPWSGVLDAANWGAPCLQAHFPDDQPAEDVPETPGEDCLVLNIWSPAVAMEEKAPVMVWLHGGGFVVGSANVRLYDGESLARKGRVVVVSINHRLNLLGYTYFGGLDPAYESSSNTGQLDIVLALHWIRDNIARFGGDPDNVTLFGQSGGGAKVSTLMCMPSAVGLFHKAIAQSGYALINRNREQATEVAAKVMRIAQLPERDVEQLRGWSVHRIAALIQSTTDYRTRPFEPIVDGTTLPAATWVSQAPASAAEIPLLIGTAHHEGAAMFGTQALATAPHSDEELARKFVSGLVFLPPLSAAEAERLVLAYRRSYPDATPAEMLIGTSTWAMFTGHAIKQAELSAKAGGQVFMYRFDWKCPAFGGMYAPHEGEVPLEFGNVDYKGDLWEPGGSDSPATRAAADPDGQRYQVSEKMIGMWSAFARNGNPSTPTASWPRYSLERRATMLIDAHSRVVEDPDATMRKELA